MQLADYVQNISGGATIIQSAGMDVKAAKSPAGVPSTVINPALMAGDNAGEVDAQWNPISGTKTYEVQTSPETR